MAPLEKIHSYWPLFVAGFICVAVASYLLGYYMGQVKMRARYTKLFDKTREEKLGITKDKVKSDYALPGTWAQHGGDLSTNERKFVSKQIMTPLINEVLTQEMPWGRWSTGHVEWPDGF